MADTKTLEALAHNAEQTGHGQAWDRMVEGLAGGQSNTIKLFLKAVNPTAIRELTADLAAAQSRLAAIAALDDAELVALRLVAQKAHDIQSVYPPGTVGYGEFIHALTAYRVQSGPQVVLALLDRLATAEAGRKLAEERLAALERDDDKTMTERDDAEDALYMACEAIYSRVPAEDRCKVCPVENCEPETCIEPAEKARDWYLSEAAGERIKRDRKQAADALRAQEAKG